MNKKKKMVDKKNKKLSAEYIIKNKDKILQQRKKRKRRKRRIILLILLLIILCTLAVKLPYFNITSFKVSGNKNLPYEYVDSVYSQFKGQNIFLFNKKLFKQKVKENQYVDDVEIKRILPNSIKVFVKERRASFYIKGKEGYFTMDSRGNILEKNNKLINKELIQILGFNDTMIKDKKLVMNDRQKNVLTEFDDLCKKNNSDINIDGINLYNITAISATVNKLTINIGTEYDLKSKLNKAINIISSHDILDKEGYVDVSFNGNPVVKVK